jgi:hypothetical protein
MDFHGGKMMINTGNIGKRDDKEKPLSEMYDYGDSKAVLGAECVVLIALAVTVVWIALIRAGSPVFDEFYHLLAARSWLADGSLAIGDGEYTRGWLFTKAIGVFYAVFGESTRTARMVPAVGAVAWLFLIFLWMRLFIGRPAAWVTVLLVLFSHEFLKRAVFIRFYTWHGFFVFLGFFLVTLAVYTSASRAYRILAGVGAVLALVVAYHLQPTTLIAVMGILAWLALTHLSAIALTLEFLAKRKGLLLLTFAAGATALGGSVALGIPQILWVKYTQTAVWNMEASRLVYHWFFAGNYTILWAVFPFTAIAAAVYRPPFSLSCTVIFSIAFLLHSFGGMRSVHYLLYAFPFFCMASAISIVLITQWLYRRIGNFDRIFLNDRLAGFRLVGFAWVCVLLITGPLFITYNAGIQKSLVILAGQDSGFRNGSSWSDFSAELNRIADEVEVIVVTYGVAGIYYLGDIDYVLSRTILRETDTKKEFGYDARIGRHVISTAESLREIMNRHASGLIVVDRLRWSNPLLGTDDEAIQLIEATMQRVTGLNTDDVFAFTWKQDVVPETTPPATYKIKATEP